MSMGWVCGLCGASNAPLLLQCPCSSSTATTATDAAAPPQTAAATTEAPPQQADARKKVLGSEASKASTSKSKYDYPDPLFRSFWSAFPLKRGKAAAYRRWRQVIAAGVEAQIVIDAAAKYAVEVNGKEAQFIKWPQGWLTDGRWEDEAEVRRLPSALDLEPAFGTPEYDARSEAEWAALKAREAIGE